MNGLTQEQTSTSATDALRFSCFISAEENLTPNQVQIYAIATVVERNRIAYRVNVVEREAFFQLGECPETRKDRFFPLSIEEYQKLAEKKYVSEGGQTELTASDCSFLVLSDDFWPVVGGKTSIPFIGVPIATAISKAIEEDSTGKLAGLSALGVDLLNQTVSNVSLPAVAAEHGCINILKLLVEEKGLDLTVQGAELAQLAAANDQYEILVFLQEKGVPLETNQEQIINTHKNRWWLADLALKATEKVHNQWFSLSFAGQKICLQDRVYVIPDHLATAIKTVTNKDKDYIGKSPETFKELLLAELQKIKGSTVKLLTSRDVWTQKLYNGLVGEQSATAFFDEMLKDSSPKQAWNNTGIDSTPTGPV